MIVLSKFSSSAPVYTIKLRFMTADAYVLHFYERVQQGSDKRCQWPKNRRTNDPKNEEGLELCKHKYTFKESISYRRI